MSAAESTALSTTSTRDEVWSWMPRAGLGGLQRLAVGIHAELQRQGEPARMWFTGGDPTRLIAEVAPESHCYKHASLVRLMVALAVNRPRILLHHTGTTHRWLPLLWILSPRTRHVRMMHQGFGSKRDVFHSLSFALTTAVIFPTEASREHSRQTIHLAEAKRHFIRYGVLLPAQVSPPSGPGPTRLILLSRIDPGKGQLAFVAAVRQACRSHPGLTARLAVEIWGGHAPESRSATAYLAELEQAIADPVLAGCVRLCGHTANPSVVLCSADWLIFPSDDEFYGLTLVEAYAHGIPALCTRSGSFTELHDETRGRFLDLADPDLASRQLAALLDVSVAQRRSLGEASREWALAHGGLDRCVRHLRGLWSQEP